MMQFQDQTLLLTELVTSDEDYLIPLTEDEQDCIQGGVVTAAAVVGAAAAVGALGVQVYTTFTTEKERIGHRAVAGLLPGIARRTVEKAGEAVVRLAPKYA